MNSSLILTFLAAVSALLFLKANQWGPKRHEYIFKPLTTILILLIVLTAPSADNDLYKWAVAAGLLFSLAGDVFLLLPKNRFIFGLLSFLVAHLFFIAAFISDESAPALWVLIPFAIYGGLMMITLRPYLGRLLLPAAIYALALMAMGWLAATRWTELGSTSSLLAFIGAVLFIISDSIMILHRFRSPIKNARLIYMTFYYLALGLIAWSVVLY